MRTLFLILALSAPTALLAMPVFDALDTNKDGELSITEFQAERTKRSTCSMRTKISRSHAKNWKVKVSNSV